MGPHVAGQAGCDRSRAGRVRSTDGGVRGWRRFWPPAPDVPAREGSKTGRPQVLPTAGQVQPLDLPRGQPISGGLTTDSPVPTHQGRLATKPHGLWPRAACLRKQQEAPVGLRDLRHSLSPRLGRARARPPRWHRQDVERGRLGLTSQPLASRAGSWRQAQSRWLTKAAGQSPAMCTSGEKSTSN